MIEEYLTEREKLKKKFDSAVLDFIKVTMGFEILTMELILPLTVFEKVINEIERANIELNKLNLKEENKDG